MPNLIFPTSIYWVYKIPNFQEIKSFADSQKNVDNSNFSWGQVCKIDRILLKSNQVENLIKPSLELFWESFKKPANIRMYHPWINLYKKDYFQEVHEHDSDISCTFFLNDGPDFSKFYFFNRHSNGISNSLRDLFDVTTDQTFWFPNCKEGEVLFFPGSLLHGVTPHNSDIVRKTLTINFDILPL